MLIIVVTTIKTTAIKSNPKKHFVIENNSLCL